MPPLHASPSPPDELAPPASSPRSLPGGDGPATPGDVAPRREARLVVLGMTCASCVRHVEQALVRQPGVRSASVDLAGSRATVIFDDTQASLEDLAAVVREEGYDVPAVTLHGHGQPTAPKPVEPTAPSDSDGAVAAASLPGSASADQAAFVVERAVADEQRKLRRELLVSALFAVPLLVLAMSHGTIAWAVSPAGRWTQGALATVILLGPGLRFFRLAARATARRTADMNTLVAIGAGSAYAYSAVALAAPSWLSSAGAHAGMAPPLYFEASGAIVTFLLLGKWLESRAKQHLGDAVRGLLALRPKTARVVARDPDGVASAAPREVSLERLAVGDWVQVLPGERIPVDGRVVKGSGHVDESLLTGESLPIAKQVDETVVGGAQNLDGTLTIETTRLGRDGAIAQIIEAVESARGSRPPIAALADRVSAVFVPVVLLLAVITFGAWWAVDPSRAGAGFALERMVAVLVIACPCALGLATPAALAVATGRGAELGILLRGGAALEAASRVTHVFLDKTGTVTAGKPTLTHLEPWSMPTATAGDTALPTFEKSELLRLAASVEAGSEHLLGRAIVQRARVEGVVFPEATGSRTVAGQGIEATVEGTLVRVGTLAFVSAGGSAASDSTSDLTGARERVETLAKEGVSPFALSVAGRLVGLLGVSDELHPDARGVVAALRHDGIDVTLLTGDRQGTAEAIGKQLSLTNILGEQTPEGKARVVEQARKDGAVVAMVGDGINDAVALAAADVGVAMGSGTDVAASLADLTLLSGGIGRLPVALGLARATLHTIRSGLFWAFVYNVVGIPIAAGVLYPSTGLLLSPVLASAAMSLSSVSVLLNALRLRTFATGSATRSSESPAAPK
jgi:P-type Cu+ transporter